MKRLCNSSLLDRLRQGVEANLMRADLPVDGEPHYETPAAWRARAWLLQEAINEIEAMSSKALGLIYEVERMEKENFALAANQCKAGYSGEAGDHMCHLLDACRETLSAHDTTAMASKGPYRGPR